MKRLLLLWVCLAISFGAGYCLDKQEPQVITRVEYITLDPEIRYIVKMETEYVDKVVEVPVETIKEVTREVEVPVKPKDFDDYTQLKALINEWGEYQWKDIPLTGADGRFGQGQCYARAMNLRNFASDNGWNVEIISIDSHLYNQKFNQKIPINEGHTICQAKVGWYIWFIEPANSEMQIAFIIP